LEAPKGEGDDTPSSVQFQEERLKRQRTSGQHAWPQDAIGIEIILVRLEPAPVFDLDSALFCHAFFLPVCWTAEVSATSALFAWQPMKLAHSKKQSIRLIFAETYP